MNMRRLEPDGSGVIDGMAPDPTIDVLEDASNGRHTRNTALSVTRQRSKAAVTFPLVRSRVRRRGAETDFGAALTAPDSAWKCKINTPTSWLPRPHAKEASRVAASSTE
jgi:hypothetical protein